MRMVPTMSEQVNRRSYISLFLVKNMQNFGRYGKQGSSQWNIIWSTLQANYLSLMGKYAHCSVTLRLLSSPIKVLSSDLQGISYFSPGIVWLMNVLPIFLIRIYPHCQSAVCPDGSICNNISVDLCLPTIEVICNNAVSGHQQNPVYR